MAHDSSKDPKTHKLKRKKSGVEEEAKTQALILNSFLRKDNKDF
jgi:hypothetical protein